VAAPLPVPGARIHFIATSLTLCQSRDAVSESVSAVHRGPARQRSTSTHTLPLTIASDAATVTADALKGHKSIGRSPDCRVCAPLREPRPARCCVGLATLIRTLSTLNLSAGHHRLSYSSRTNVHATVLTRRGDGKGGRHNTFHSASGSRWRVVVTALRAVEQPQRPELARRDIWMPLHPLLKHTSPCEPRLELCDGHAGVLGQRGNLHSVWCWAELEGDGQHFETVDARRRRSRRLRAAPCAPLFGRCAH